MTYRLQLDGYLGALGLFGPFGTSLRCWDPWLFLSPLSPAGNGVSAHVLLRCLLWLISGFITELD